MMPLAPAEPVLYVAAFLMIFGTSACASALSSLLSQYTNPGSRGGVLGLGQAFAGSGRIVGPALAGVVFASVGIHWPYFFGAMAMVVMAVGSRMILVKRASELQEMAESDAENP